YGANTLYKTDYSGKEILTDNRMSMYAWWFESKIAEFSSLEVATITPEGLNIPGIKKSSLETVLELPKNEKLILEFVENPLALNYDKKSLQEKLVCAISELKEYLASTKELVEKGLKITKKTGLTKQDYPEIFFNLQQIDKKLVNTEASELISLLFPSEEDLQACLDSLPKIDKMDVLYLEKENLQKSMLIYTKLLEAINQYEKISFPNFS
ncbi:MAG: hypothetical protein IKI98_01965, partial [Spirochaetaceae bacterium]|nr:hypothetical protein [Spirochaetaceae bacterium]